MLPCFTLEGDCGSAVWQFAIWGEWGMFEASKPRLPQMTCYNILLTGISVTAVFFDPKSTDQNPYFGRGIVPEFNSAGVRGISGDCMTILVYTTFPVCWIPRDDFLFVFIDSRDARSGALAQDCSVIADAPTSTTFGCGTFATTTH